MTYIFAFLFSAFFSFIAQIIVEYSKLTPGHITSIYVVIGVILGISGIYPILIEIFQGGAVVPILNFGYLLTKGIVEDIHTFGFLGIFTGVFKYTSITLSFVIFFSVALAIFFKVKA